MEYLHVHCISISTINFNHTVNTKLESIRCISTFIILYNKVHVHVYCMHRLLFLSTRDLLELYP